MNSLILFLTGLICFHFASVVCAQESLSPNTSSTNIIEGKVEGILLERGTKNPLGEVNVFILPHKLKTITNAKGEFVFAKVPVGPFKFVINNPNYEKFELDNTLDVQEPSKVRRLYLSRDSYSSFETTVIDRKSKKDPSAKTLNQNQFLTIPGASGDPVKAIQNLPGINRTAGFSSQVIIQGSAPSDTTYNIDGHKVPIIFHFGGLTSVVMPESVASVDYLSAGFGPEYSKALGGVISLKTKAPDPGPHTKKGFFFVDTLKAGAQVEGRIDEDSTYLLSARYSYIGFVLKQALKDRKEFNLTVAPEFMDLTSIYETKLNDSDRLKIVGVGSRDIIAFLLSEPVKSDPSIRGKFTNETKFIRIIPQWSRKINDNTNVNLSFGIGQDQYLIDIGDKYFRSSIYELTIRGEWNKSINSNWKTFLGFDNEYSTYQIGVRLPVSRSGAGGVSNPISTAEIKEVQLTGKTVETGVFWKNEYRTDEHSPWTFLPSLRADRFQRTKENLLSPRLTAKWDINGSLQSRISIGQYYQPVLEQQSDPSFGNPQLKSTQARHYALSFEKDFRDNSDRGFTLTTGYFRRDFNQLVISSTSQMVRDGVLVPEVYNNGGKGMAHGLELLLRTEFRPFSGWISYTLSRSTRWDDLNTETVYQYDQTHNFNVVGSYDFPKDFKISGRYRYVTGNPSTPIVGGIFDADNDVYVPQRGALYSERLSAFQQLDLRLDKKYLTNSEIYTLYLDVQNVLNNKNSETVQYAYDYSTKEDVTGLPFIFAFGIKGEF